MTGANQCLWAVVRTGQSLQVALRAARLQTSRGARSTDIFEAGPELGRSLEDGLKAIQQALDAIAVVKPECTYPLRRLKGAMVAGGSEPMHGQRRIRRPAPGSGTVRRPANRVGYGASAFAAALTRLTPSDLVMKRSRTSARTSLATALTYAP